jgi:hypothetical protein
MLIYLLMTQERLFPQQSAISSHLSRGSSRRSLSVAYVCYLVHLMRFLPHAVPNEWTRHCQWEQRLHRVPSFRLCQISYYGVVVYSYIRCSRVDGCQTTRYHSLWVPRGISKISIRSHYYLISSLSCFIKILPTMITTILDVIHYPALYWKHKVSETGLCLHLQVVHTNLGPIGRGSQMSVWHQDRLADWPSGVT